MEFWSAPLVSLLLLSCALAMVYMHLRSWSAAQKDPNEAAHLEYRRRQYRRRMQTSIMLGVLALAIGIGPALKLSPLWLTIYWTGVLAFTVWVGVLALVDIWATRHHFNRLRDRYAIEQARLEAEARRIKQRRSGGKSRGRGQPDPPEARS